MDQLMAWLSGAEASLVSQEQVPVPDNVPIIEQLLHDHQTFEQDIQVRSHRLPPNASHRVIFVAVAGQTTGSGGDHEDGQAPQGRSAADADVIALRTSLDSAQAVASQRQPHAGTRVCQPARGRPLQQVARRLAHGDGPPQEAAGRTRPTQRGGARAHLRLRRLAPTLHALDEPQPHAHHGPLPAPGQGPRRPRDARRVLLGPHHDQ